MNDIRQIISMNGDWDFSYSKTAPDLENITFPKNETYETKIPVPAYWDDCKNRLKYAKFWSRDCVFNPDYREIEFPMGGLKPPDASLPYLIGTGWYKKSFTSDEDWNEKTVTLHIGGVTMEAWVWLNGMYVGHHEGYLTPFEFDLKSALKVGEENELIIAVSNLRKDRIGTSIRGYKGKSAGITRSVFIQVTGSVRIKDCFVRTDSELKNLFWELELQGMDFLHNEVSIDWEIIDPITNTIEACGDLTSSEVMTKWVTESFQLEPWSENNPRLYKLHIIIKSGKIVLDEHEQNFGLRFMERQGIHLLMNGKSILLRGLTEHAYFPETCTVPTDTAYYIKAIKALKRAGFNWMRCHTWTPPEECLDVADRLGMLIQVETPNGFSENNFLDMIMTCRKHPSVILYCCGNEVPITDEFNDTMELMANHCHTLAKGTLFDPMEALLNIECRLDESDPGYKTEPTPHNAIKLEKLKSYSDVLAPGVWVFSYHSLYSDIEKINERFSIYERPCLVHEAGINDTYLNLDLEKRYENTRIGTSLFTAARKYIKEMGLIQNAPTYYRNSCRWMRQLTKYSMEKARRCSNITGYDFLGAIDCHWHRTGYAVGVLNEFYELKSGFSYEDLQQFNGESVLLADCGINRSLVAGTTLKLPLFASLYGTNHMENGILTWYFEDEMKNIYSHNSRVVNHVDNGCIFSFGEIEIPVPVVKGIGQHLYLKVRLSGDNYEINNCWDYWVFNSDEKHENNSNKVKILKKLDDESVEYMVSGGRILLLGNGYFPGLPISYQMMPGGRTHGNNSTVIYEHPLMRDFPQDGFCDWQFQPLFRDGGAIVFNDLDIPFEPILEIVSSYKYIMKQASIFELSVGNGGMLVCTLNVESMDLAAINLYNCMLKYITSDEFKPSVKVTTEWLKDLSITNKDLNIDFTTDECYDTGGHIEV